MYCLQNAIKWSTVRQGMPVFYMVCSSSIINSSVPEILQPNYTSHIDILSDFTYSSNMIFFDINQHGDSFTHEYFLFVLCFCHFSVWACVLIHALSKYSLKFLCFRYIPSFKAYLAKKESLFSLYFGFLRMLPQTVIEPSVWWAVQIALVAVTVQLWFNLKI